MKIRKLLLQAARMFCAKESDRYCRENVLVQDTAEGPRMIAIDGMTLAVIEDPGSKMGESADAPVLISVGAIDAMGKVPKRPRTEDVAETLDVTEAPNGALNLAMSDERIGSSRRRVTITIDDHEFGKFPDPARVYPKLDGYRHQLFRPRLLLRALEAIVLALDPFDHEDSRCVLSMGPEEDRPLMISSVEGRLPRISILAATCDFNTGVSKEKPWMPFPAPNPEPTTAMTPKEGTANENERV